MAKNTSKYIFLTLPAYGHVNPTLAIARELVRRRQKVIYYLPEEFREVVQPTGAAFRPYESRLMKQIAQMSPMLAPEARLVLPQVLDQIRTDAPDVILHEPVCVWTRIITHMLKVPAISLRPTYAMNEQFNLFTLCSQLPGARVAQMSEILAKVNADLADLCAEYAISPMEMSDVFAYAEPLNIAFFPREFQPRAETFDGRHLFVGPSIFPRNIPFDRFDPERPLLYISLGTIFNNEPTFFKQCFAAFGESNYQVLLSRGKRIDPATLGSIPDNFLVSSYLPQLDILAHARVFITHAGMNSTMESLYYGVPMIAVPQTEEQALTARRIAEMELGIALDKATLTAATLRHAVERVANDPAFHERARQMRQITRAAGGYQRAADAIIHFTQQQSA